MKGNRPLAVLALTIALIMPSGLLAEKAAAQSNAKNSHSLASESRPKLPRAYYDRHDVSPEEARERFDKDMRWSHFLSRPLKDPGTPDAPKEVDIDIIWHLLGHSTALPLGDSVAVIVGTVRQSKGFITSSKTGAYSEYSVEVKETLKDDPESPVQVGKTIRVTQSGATVIFPSGSVAHVYVRGRGIPQLDHTVVLFLGQHRQAHERDYSILRVYDIDKGIVLPLDSAGDYRGMDASEFLTIVRANIRQAAGGE